MSNRLPRIGSIIRDITGHRWVVKDNTEEDLMTGEPMIRVGLVKPSRTYLLLNQIHPDDRGEK